MSTSEDTAAVSTGTGVPSEISALARRLLPKVRKCDAPVDSSHACAITGLQNLTLEDSDLPLNDVQILLLAVGGYNDVWHVQSDDVSFILRVPNEESLRPYQIRNEVGWLNYMAKHCSELPVPKVYDYSDGSEQGDLSFIAEQYVDGIPLSEAWQTYTESEKDTVARNLAEVVVRLGELRFKVIGGMTPTGEQGPTVEGCKLFKGRDAFHGADYYPIGPYASVKEYVLAYYDKEIYYYSHADASALDMDLFEECTPANFVEQLKEQRAAAVTELESNTRNEPFVLCHNDLQGRNILMQKTDIVSVIDWEFAGSYPLSELDDGGIEVLEMVDEASEEECFRWSSEISKLTAEVAKQRGWTEREVGLLTGGGDAVLQAVRTEMIPES